MVNWLGMGPPPGPRSGVLMDITTALNECKGIKCPLNLNKLKLPITNLGFNPKDINIFNTIYAYCVENEKKGLFEQFVPTRSGGISIKEENILGPRYLLTITNAIIELLLKDDDLQVYRIIVGYNKDKLDKDAITGRKAFICYKNELKKDGVDIESLAIPNGKEVKETIPAPKIELCLDTDVTYFNAHHIDINSAYNAGMSEAYPVLRKSVERMYSKRKEKPEFKQVLNMTQGFMQSKLVDYKFAHISKAGYEYTLKRLEEISKQLTDAGYEIIAYNTDGIWYRSFINTEPYHREGEGTALGEWKNDHTFCKLRFKSKGSYEYVENGEYHPVVRGTTTYERIKPRSEWQWGDIYKGDIINYYFEKDKGLIEYVCT